MSADNEELNKPETDGQMNTPKSSRDILFILLLVGSLMLLVSLITYSPEQGGWSAVGYHASDNAVGKVGAYVADFLFHGFGLLAYVLPLLIMGKLLWMLRKDRKASGPLALRLLGMTLSMLSLCALADISILSVDYLPVGAGGMIGTSLMEALLPLFSFIGSIIIMLALLALGLMLFLEFSWLVLFEQIGGVLLSLSSSIRQRRAKTPEPPQSHSEPEEPDIFFSELVETPPKPLLEDIAPPVLRDDPQPVSKRRKSVMKRLESEKSNGIEQLDDPTLVPPPVSSGKNLPNKKMRAKPAEEQAAADIPIEPLEKKDSKPSERALRDLQGSLFKSSQPLPSIALLDPAETDKGSGFSPERLQEMSKLLVQKLADFGVKVEVTAVAPGPVITRFEIQPAPGIKASKISGLASDLARSMAMIAVRVVEVIPGKSVMGIEVPNENRAIVRLSEVLSSQEYDKSSSPLTMALGHDIGGNPVVANLAKMPHLLVAGTTGSGKSVGVNAMIISLLLKATPDELRLIMVDPKMLELSVYEGIPHLLTPVITDMKEAANGLRWSVEEMERRYQLMAALGVRNIAGYNKKVSEAQASGEPILDPLWQIHQSFDTTHPTLEPLPYIVIVIDEFADMMMMVGKKVEELIARIAQKARAAGIHMILATQRPSVDVITGLIKANVPTRIAFQVSSKIDSRTILDQGGAEQLLGHGDMLFMPPGNALPERVHGAFVDDDEVHRVVAEWKQRGEPEYIEEITQTAEERAGSDGDAGGEQDDLYDQAVAFVTETGKCSISSVQRKLRIGYNRAARLVESMEAGGVVSPPAHNGSREVLARPAPSDIN